MTPSAAKKKRDQWKLSKINQRERRKRADEILNNTPESINESIEEEPQHEPEHEPQLEPQLENAEQLATSSPEDNDGNRSTKCVYNEEKNLMKDEITKLKKQLKWAQKKS